jgi:hypothetical protein
MIESLSPLAHAQLRLDVEAIFRKADRHGVGRRAVCPVDFDFFDPFELSEEQLETSMQDLNLAEEFESMRRQAAARFPQQEVKDPLQLYNSVDWHSMKGIFCRATQWNKERAGPSGIDQFAEAVNLPESSPARQLIEKVADRLRLRKTIGVSEFSYWAMFAVFTLLDDHQFELFLGVASDMSLMFAGELAHALSVEPLRDRMKRKAMTGGAPSVMYEALPLDP